MGPSDIELVRVIKNNT